jgi:hypothetical protein
MNQNYKFKSLQFEDSKSSTQRSDEIEIFQTGETKTIDFVQLDGTRQSFPYGHYMTAWIGKENDERFIKIFFATHLVTIKGYCLDDIYNQLLQYKLKSVKANDERYSNSITDDKSFVFEIDIQWKGQE